MPVWWFSQLRVIGIPTTFTLYRTLPGLVLWDNFRCFRGRAIDSKNGQTIVIRSSEFLLEFFHFQVPPVGLAGSHRFVLGSFMNYLPLLRSFNQRVDFFRLPGAAFRTGVVIVRMALGLSSNPASAQID
jgi:hypothetical protein